VHTFDTPTPPQLTIEFRSGDITIDARDVTETSVELSGRRDDEDSRAMVAATIIEQRGEAVVVFVPKRSFASSGRDPELRLHVTAPTHTRLAVKSGSADLQARGTFGDSRVDSGSGDVALDHLDGPSRVRTGSGDVEVERASAELHLQTGSGDIRIARLEAAAKVQSGSGDVRVDAAERGLVIQTGSGDISVGQADDDVKAQTGSGDVHLGSVRKGNVQAQGASGDIHVGVVPGTAAWLDVKTLTGRVESDLESSDVPDDEEQRVRLKLNTVSGDIAVVRS